MSTRFTREYSRVGVPLLAIDTVLYLYFATYNFLKLGILDSTIGTLVNLLLLKSLQVNKEKHYFPSTTWPKIRAINKPKPCLCTCLTLKC